MHEAVAVLSWAYFPHVDEASALLCAGLVSYDEQGKKKEVRRKNDPSDQQIEKPFSVAALNGFGLVSLWVADRSNQKVARRHRIFKCYFLGAHRLTPFNHSHERGCIL